MNESITPETKPIKPLERIGDFDVHPVASIFPMMSAKEEQDLGVSISDLGLQEPIVIHEGVLVDGRNRLKVCLAINEPVRTVEWSKVVAHNCQRHGKGGLDDFPATTVDQWIMAKNLARRSVSDSQRVVLWAEYGLWQAEEEARESLKSAQFQQGKSGNPTGKASEQVDPNSGPPAPERDIAQKHANSTVGKVAAAAKVSHHKAAQAIKLVKAVEAGTAPKEDLELVKAGLKKMTDAVRPLRPERPKLTLEESVHRDMVRFMDRYAVADHRKIEQLVAGFFRKK